MQYTCSRLITSFCGDHLTEKATACWSDTATTHSCTTATIPVRVVRTCHAQFVWSSRQRQPPEHEHPCPAAARLHVRNQATCVSVLAMCCFLDSWLPARTWRPAPTGWLPMHCMLSQALFVWHFCCTHICLDKLKSNSSNTTLPPPT